MLLYQRFCIAPESFAHERMREAERQLRSGGMDHLCPGFGDLQLHVRERHFRQDKEAVIRVLLRQANDILDMPGMLPGGLQIGSIPGMLSVLTLPTDRSWRILRRNVLSQM